MDYNIEEAISNFNIKGNYLKSYSYGSGHINDTYVIEMDQADSLVCYILQRINTNVFTRPVELMDNISRVTSHCRSKFEDDDLDRARKVLTVIHSRDGNPYFVDSKGEFWRMYLFIKEARTYDIPENNDQIYQAAKAFGLFQKQLVDLPGSLLFETIPDFHDGPKRFKALQQAVKEDKFNRAAIAKDEIEKIENLAWVFEVLPEQVAQGNIPIRITHNDTKFNNVMIEDKTGEGICVYDLETVMPGLALYDFGDMVRTTVSQSAEDEVDLSKVEMKIDRFEAVLRGYMSEASDFLNDSEKQNLILSGKMMTLMVGTRFLTDFLNGDTYFKIHRENHNLDRCRTQTRIVELIMNEEDQLDSLLEKVLRDG